MFTLAEDTLPLAFILFLLPFALAPLPSAQASESNSRGNARVAFRLGLKNSEYLLHLYSLFKQFVGTPPSLNSYTDENGKTKYDLSFNTLSLPCF